MDIQNKQFRCIIHGSFRKHFKEIMHAKEIFESASIEVLAPSSNVIHIKDQFSYLENDKEKDPRLIELLYLHHLKRLGRNGFSYFVNPKGYIGRSSSYELGIAQISNVPCFFLEQIKDHPAYQHGNSIWRPELLADYINKYQCLPDPKIKINERKIHKLWLDLMVPGSVVAVGGIIELVSHKREKDILLVKTHKWGNRFSIVGGRVKRNELLDNALKREIKEETGLEAKIGNHLCTFDQLEESNYYQGGIQHIFADKAVKVRSNRVRLNEEAEDYLWIPPRKALKELDIEPNARYTLEIYTKFKYPALIL